MTNLFKVQLSFYFLGLSQ